MTKKDVPAVLGVLLGEAPTAARATRVAGCYSPCPYCVSFTSVGGTIIAVFALPPEQRWWLEEIEKRPGETLGLNRAEVFFARQIGAASPWSRGEVEPVAELSPCGSGCSQCPAYRERCPGCPATQHYLAGGR